MLRKIVLAVVLSAALAIGVTAIVRANRAEKTAEPTVKASTKVAPYLYCSNFVFENDHGGGANLWLWRTGENAYVGLFHLHEGDIGYGAESELENIKADEKSVSFSYQQKLWDTEGQMVLGERETFTGTREGDKLIGRLETRGGPIDLPMDCEPQQQAIAFHPFFVEFPSVEEWRANVPPQKKEF